MTTAPRPVPRRAPRPAFWTVTEVAGMLRVSKMTVYRLVHDGEIRATRVRNSFRIAPPDFDDYKRRAGLW